MNQSLNTISFNITDGIGHIELIQPPSNLMTSEFFTEFTDLVDGLKVLKGLKAIIISSRGRHFSSGANLEELLEMVAADGERTDKIKKDGLRTTSERNYRSFLFFEQTEIPVIAAIRGVCIGSAFELALFAHFRFCGEDAVFGLPETTYNLIPGLGGIRKTFSLCGQAKTLELILKGNTFGAEEALQYHLVDRIVPKRKVVEFSMAFARKIMQNYKKQKVSLYLQQIALNDPFFN